MLRAAAVGDEAAQRLLIERYYPAVRIMVHRELSLDLRKGRSWINGLFSTGDIVHDVFLGVLQGLEDFRGDERAFEGYLASMVTHRLLDMIRFHQAGRRDGRRRASQDELTDREVETHGLSPTVAAQRSEEIDAVKAALAKLPSRDRVLLDMRFGQGANYRTIANAFGFPTAEAARKAVRSARARLLVRYELRGNAR